MTGVESSLFIDHRGTIWGCGGGGVAISANLLIGEATGVCLTGAFGQGLFKVLQEFIFTIMFNIQTIIFLSNP